MARVDVSRDVLEWAVKRSGKKAVIEKRFPNFLKWINKEQQPTLNQLEKLAKATSTPLGYFFLPNAPEEQLSIPHYRTIDDSQMINPSPDLLETVQMMERRQDWIREYLIDNHYDPLHFVGIKNIKSNPVSVAKEIRKELGLKDGWASSCKTWQEALRMLIDRVDNIRVIVVVNGVVGNNTHRRLNVDEFRGFVLIDEYAPLIFINGADGKAAQMFTLAHELAHIWFGVSAAFDLQTLQPANNEVEVACNLVAAEFLVPEKELKNMWPTACKNPQRFQALARYFKVSEIVVARRALDLKMITREDYFDFYKRRFIEGAQGSTKGGNFYATQVFRVGRYFGEMVVRATKEGKLSYNEAYRLTGLKGKTFSEFADRLGFGGSI
jgi:Zn-dependent peptidase ImmA (M78 family)